MRNREKGFTLVEVLVVAPIMILSAFVILGYLIDLYGQTIVGNAEVNLQLEAQNVLSSMQDDIIFAAGFEETISSDTLNQVSDPNEPSGGWTYATDPDTLVVVETSLTTSRSDPNRDFVRRDYFGCTTAKESNPRVFNNIIYFVDSGSLFKRTLPAGDESTLCDPPFKQRTCPESAATSDCLKDPELTSKVTLFEITYFDENDVVLDVDGADSPTDAEKIRIDITLSDKVYATDISASSSLTVRNLNET